MFSLGSFSSIMPILILAITYLAGLTTYSLNFAQNKIDDQKIADKNVLELKQSKNEAHESNTCHFSDVQDDYLSIKQNTNTSFVVSIPILKTRILNRPPYISENFKRSLYMRPPPSFLFALV